MNHCKKEIEKTLQTKNVQVKLTGKELLGCVWVERYSKRTIYICFNILYL